MASSSVGRRHETPLLPKDIGRREASLLAMVLVAVVLGGGGVGYGFFNLAVQLVALAILALNRDCLFAFFTEAPRALVALVLATAVLPLLQLVPLPPVVWTALAGRELVSESLALTGSAEAWMPLSLDPNRTLLGFIGLLPGIAVLALAWGMNGIQARRACWLVVFLAVFGLALGAVQLASGNQFGNWYAGGNPEHVYATFANRNSTGIFFVIAMVVLTALSGGGDRAGGISPLRIALLVGFALGAMLTQSRSSTFLLLVPALFVALRTRLGATRESAEPRRGGMLGRAIVLALAMAASAFLFATNDKLHQTVERFENFEDARQGIWEDSLVTAGRYWPVGSGAGTFDEVFQVDESLEYLTPGRAGRAHNDYLELTIESGAIGLLLLFAWSVWYAHAVFRSGGSNDPLLRRGAAAVLACLMLQSLLDYPLRNEALLCIAALMIAVLGRPAGGARQNGN